MKKLQIITIIAFIPLFVQPAWSQGQGGNSTDQVAMNNEKSDFYPLAYFDPRIRLKKVSFVKRHSDTGKGEFLDVQIELDSRVMKAHNYSIYVIAAYERDAQNDDERKLVPYPSWRPYNPLEQKKILMFSNIMPIDVSPVEIWGEEELKKKQELVDKMILRGFNAELGEPNFDEYLKYLSQNPSKALPFTLYGEEGPSKDKILVHNYIPQTAEEKQGWRHETLKNHNYTMYSSKYNTTIITHHYTQYRPNFYNFNKVGILVFDPTKEKNNLIIRKIVDVTELKMSY